MIPLLKDIHKISHTSSPSTEEVVQKEPVSGPLADLVEPPGEAEGKEDFPWGVETLIAAIWGALSTSVILPLTSALLESSL